MPFRLFFQQKRHYKTLYCGDITSYLKLPNEESLLAETKTRQKKNNKFHK